MDPVLLRRCCRGGICWLMTYAPGTPAATLQHGLNNWIKTIANTAFMTRMALANDTIIGSPHFAYYAPGYFAVTSDGTRVDSPHRGPPNHSRVSLHHYVTKSLQVLVLRWLHGRCKTVPVAAWPYICVKRLCICSRWPFSSRAGLLG